jgi:hypothetical protein
MPVCLFICGIDEHYGSIVAGANDSVLEYFDIANAVLVHLPHRIHRKSTFINCHYLSITVSNQNLFAVWQ